VCALPPHLIVTHHETHTMSSKLYLPILDNGQGSCRTDFLSSFIKSFAGQAVHIDRISDSHPGRARNRAAGNFLSTDCDYLLFIDGDIHFHRGHIEMLMESNEPVLGGIYCIKTADETRPCLQTLPGHAPIACGGLAEVRRTGTGFLRIHRSVFEKLKDKATRYTNHGRPEWDFFPSGVINGEWLSEDWYFCDLAREAGFKVMIDTRVQVGHEGSIVYPIRKAPDRLNVCPADMKPHMERIWKGEYEVELDAPPASILDVGANIGGFTAWAKEKWPDACVYAYEPAKDNCALFRFNTAQFRDVELLEVGITADGGPRRLCHGTNCGEHSLKFEGLAGEDVFTIKAINLPACEFVKLDCEGCELEILEQLDLSAARAVCLEYHVHDDRAKIEALLESKGFEIKNHECVDDGRGVLKFTRRQNTNTQ
jgi:FkbM family methyltransferase